MNRACWSARASAESVRQIREAVVDFICADGVTDSQVDDIGLAVSEAVTNAVVHAYRGQAEPGDICVSATATDGWLELCVVDNGSGMAPRTDSPGVGLGLPLIYQLADQVDVRRPPGGAGTELWMRFRL